MAHICVDRGLDGITLYDGSLQGPEVETLDAYVEVLTLASKISFIHGEVKRAVDELRHAIQFNPLDKCQLSQIETLTRAGKGRALGSEIEEDRFGG